MSTYPYIPFIYVSHLASVLKIDLNNVQIIFMQGLTNDLEVYFAAENFVILNWWLRIGLSGYNLLRYVHIQITFYSTVPQERVIDIMHNGREAIYTQNHCL